MNKALRPPVFDVAASASESSSKWQHQKMKLVERVEIKDQTFQTDAGSKKMGELVNRDKAD